MSAGTNQDIQVARHYHDATAHSDWSVRQSSHYLDWRTKPFLYKVYPDLPVTQLAREVGPPATDALESFAGGRPGARALTLDGLAVLLFFSAGITKKKAYPGGEAMHFRAAASTGALYQTEVYVVTGALPDLPAGVYHFSPGDFSLRRLREGDFRRELAEAASDPAIARAPAIFVLTAIYWRNTWKYEARGYRHLFWDSGTILANLLAVAAGAGFPSRIVTDFVDVRVNRLLGLDVDKEGSLELVAVGPEGPAAAEPPQVEEIAPRYLPLSKREVDYPLLRQVHAASSLADSAEVSQWRLGAGIERPSPPGDLLQLPACKSRAERTLGETILRRGSTREFARESITAQELST
ncbi:MAG: SagB/ThcOx family dehydrogenase, partial [Candidatus Methylomirabilia bacterium]